MNDRRSDDSKVICPACNNEFRAIPVNVQDELVLLRQQLDDEIQRWKNACELLNKAEAELASLKAGQGEPVEGLDELLSEYWDLAYDEGRHGGSNGSAANAVLHKLRKLYTAPTIPEGYVMMPKKVSMEMTIAASRKLGECDSGFWTRGGMLESVLIDKMYDELIAAAPKPEET